MLDRLRSNRITSLLTISVLAAAAGCGDAQYHLVLHYPDDASWQRAHREEVVVATGSRCAELTSAGQVADDLVVARIESAAHGEEAQLGQLSYGELTFYALVRDDNCMAFLAGCVEQVIQQRQDLTVTIGLLPRVETGCAGNLVCVDGQCRAPVDAGSDAGVGDAARDAAASDRVTSDTAALDVSTADTGGDGAAADRTGSDLGAADRTATDVTSADRTAVNDAAADGSSVFGWAQACQESWCDVAGSAGGLSSAVRRRNSGFGGGATAGWYDYMTAPALALGSDDRPIVAWGGTKNYGASGTYAKRWTGTNWEFIPGTGADGSITDGINQVVIARDSQDRPALAWGWTEILVSHWDGAVWSGYGDSAASSGISHNSGRSQNPTIALDSQDRPHVAWADDSSGQYQIYLRYWDGAAWQEYGGSATNGGISGTPADSTVPALAIDSNDWPVVAWQDASASRPHVYVRHWDGASWAEYGGSGSGVGAAPDPYLSTTPALALDRTDHPAVAFESVDDIDVWTWDGSAWTTYAGSDYEGHVPDASGELPVLAMDPDDNPVVAWRTGSWGRSIQLSRWSNGAWTGMENTATPSTVAATTGICSKPSLALESNGHPVVAWQDAASRNQALVRRWDGAGWVGYGPSSPAGGVSNSAGNSTIPSLAMAADGALVVAWQDETIVTSIAEWIYLKRFDGSAWQELGWSAHQHGITAWYEVSGAGPVLALGPTGVPAVLYWGTQEVGGNPYSDTTLMSWDGDSWTDGPRSPPSGEDYALAIDAADRPVIVVRSGSAYNDCDIFVYRWDGAAYAELDDASAGGGISNSEGVDSENPALTLDPAGNPVVAWLEGGHAIYVRGYDGSAWIDYAGSGSGAGAASATWGHLAVAVTATGLPVVAWSTYPSYASSDSEVYVKRFDGTAWQGLAGSDAGGGVSANAGASTNVALAVDAAGNPLVAWEDQAPGPSAIYLKRWNGNAWAEWPAGSATGGGVSNSDGNALAPSLRMVGAVACLAWSEMISNSSTEIALRCFAGPL
ncbi:MAG: hypothetical protein JXR83_10840 [Deltaproteobacteria bacterium]|nr:hypothetical protein [Deltaproteobacteria bacterium]